MFMFFGSLSSEKFKVVPAIRIVPAKRHLSIIGPTGDRGIS